MSRIQSQSGEKRPAVGHEIRRLLWDFGSWLTEEDEYSDTIMSTRIRLARNLHGHRFPGKAPSAELKQIVGEVREACEFCPSLRTASFVEIEKLSDWDCKYFVERHLASPQFIENNMSALLVVGAGETLSLMVNEEDHLRLQCIVAGLGVDQAWEMVSRLDDELEEHLNFSYSKKYGYLTACPTNLGTGMRVSVLVHLPALAFVGDVDDVITALPESEIAVRGFYGEGSDAIGNIYQISNQLTLGRTENNVIARIHSTARRLVDLEREARLRLLDKSLMRLEDSVFRALGLLQNSRLMSSLEAMNLLSTIRLGSEVGMIDHVSRLAINQLMMLVQPAHLLKIYDKDLSDDERDMIRAEFIRQNLKDA